MEVDTRCTGSHDPEPMPKKRNRDAEKRTHAAEKRAHAAEVAAFKKELARVAAEHARAMAKLAKLEGPPKKPGPPPRRGATAKTFIGMRVTHGVKQWIVTAARAAGAKDVTDFLLTKAGVPKDLPEDGNPEAP